MKISDIEKNIYKGLAEFISQKIRDEHDICLGQFESEELLDEILKRVIPIIYNLTIDNAIKSERNIVDR